jgi:hypothetical protein
MRVESFFGIFPEARPGLNAGYNSHKQFQAVNEGAVKPAEPLSRRSIGKGISVG